MRKLMNSIKSRQASEPSAIKGRHLRPYAKQWTLAAVLSALCMSIFAAPMLLKGPEDDEPLMPFKKLIRFDIAVEDETLYLALRRWATESGYQIVWDAGKDFPARNTRYTAQHMEEAIEQVMADSEGSSYPLHACTYANKVIRVLHVSQTCQRN
jgi:hypothetical protein